MARLMTMAGATLATSLVAGILLAGQALPARDVSGDDGAATTSRIARVSAATLPRLRGYVSGDGTITISRHSVPRGRYRIVVLDDTNAHNWHISGRYVDKETTVKGTGRWVWRVRLRKGTYSIVCDPHEAWMNTYLKVTAG